MLLNERLDVLHDFGVEDVLERLVRGNVFGVLLHFRHGVLSMKDAINLVDLIKEFGDDEACRRYIEALRWRKGVICPRCDQPATAIANRSQFDCDGDCDNPRIRKEGGSSIREKA